MRGASTIRAVLCATALAIVPLSWMCGSTFAQAEQTVRLEAKLTPERLGASTTMGFGFTILAPPGHVPAPLIEIDLLFPANLGIARSGLGLATCSKAILEDAGPRGCPANSHVGYGSALAEVPFGPEILRERAAVSTFMGPVHDGHLGLLFYADGISPVAAQIVFPGLVLPADAPFGGSLNTSLPLVPSVPEAPDVAVVKLRSTIGPQHLTYYEEVRGHRVPYRPAGVRLPSRCPRGGFKFAAKFRFLDGEGTSAHTIVPCPHNPHR